MPKNVISPKYVFCLLSGPNAKYGHNLDDDDSNCKIVNINFFNSLKLHYLYICTWLNIPVNYIIFKYSQPKPLSFCNIPGISFS